jgi:hypothetical protein
MNRRTQQLLDDLAEARPVQPGATRQAAPAAMRQATLERIFDDESANVRSARRRPRRLTRRAFPLALAGATFVVVTALAIGLLPGRGPGGAPPASALELAARTAAAQPYSEPGEGERWYQKQRKVGQQSDKLTGETAESWISSDGRIWSRSTDGPDGTTSIRPGEGRLFGIDAGLVPFADVRWLPTDPELLRRRLEASMPGVTPDQGGTPPIAFQALNLLSHPALRPEQRAALFRVLATTRTVRTLTGVTDPAGRPAVAVEIPSDGPVFDPTQWLFDPASTQMLAIRVIAGQDHPDLGVRKGQAYDAIVANPWTIVPDPLA